MSTWIYKYILGGLLSLTGDMNINIMTQKNLITREYLSILLIFSPHHLLLIIHQMRQPLVQIHAPSYVSTADCIHVLMLEPYSLNHGINISDTLYLLTTQLSLKIFQLLLSLFAESFSVPTINCIP